MAVATFSVSEVRVAATCPRISYFDAECTRRKALKSRAMTRLWKAGDVETACGALFHNAVEAFNKRALEAPEVRDALNGDPDPRAIEKPLRAFLNRNCVNLDILYGKSPAQQQAFVRAVAVYMGELADIVGDARSHGKPAVEILDLLFGDRRRRVDVTFQVGPNGEPVRVTGILDYVFYDWRTAHHRIIDYKLTPPGEPSNDLFQVALYALMHNVQHRTEPDVAVLYLHPERRMVELSWAQVHGQRHKLFDLLASMAEWVRYDEAAGTGLKPPGEPSCCPLCKWDKQGECVRRLGPKHAGGGKPAAKTPLIRLFTQGRKYGVACLLCTQSPRSVDYNVFGNCSTKLIGRLESQQDLERVGEWFTTDGPKPSWIAARKGAEAGSFVGRWPQMPPDLEGQAIRSRPLCSLHEGAWSPDRLEREMIAGRADNPEARSSGRIPGSDPPGE